MIETIKENPRLRRLALWLICPDGHPRPRWWVRAFLTPLQHRHGKGARISRRARLDIFPWHRFYLGRGSRIEDYAVINNGSGDVILGDDNYIGIGTVIVGPVETGCCVGIGQHVSVQGFNHGYEDVDTPPLEQEVTKRPVRIGSYTHLNTNVVVLGGVEIGERCQIGAGAVVTKNIPPYSVAVGNPARVIKRYDPERKVWVRV